MRRRAARRAAPVRDRGIAIFPLVRNNRWDIVGSDTRNARAISAVLSPATVFNVTPPPLEGQRRVADVKISRGRSSVRGSARSTAGVRVVGTARSWSCAARSVDGAARPAHGSGHVVSQAPRPGAAVPGPPGRGLVDRILTQSSPDPTAGERMRPGPPRSAPRARPRHRRLPTPGTAPASSIAVRPEGPELQPATRACGAATRSRWPRRGCRSRGRRSRRSQSFDSMNGPSVTSTCPGSPARWGHRRAGRSRSPMRRFPGSRVLNPFSIVCDRPRWLPFASTRRPDRRRRTSGTSSRRAPCSMVEVRRSGTRPIRRWERILGDGFSTSGAIDEGRSDIQPYGATDNPVRPPAGRRGPTRTG